MKFTDYYYQWYTTYRITDKSKATIHRYEIYYRAFQQSNFGDKELADIAKNDIQEYITTYGETHVKNSVKVHLRIITACFKQAIEDKLLNESPVKNIELNYKEKYMTQEELLKIRNEKKWLEIDEYERMKQFLNYWLNQALDHKPFYFVKRSGSSTLYAQVIMMAIFILFKTGMRFSEALGLTKYDIDFEHNKLSINKSFDYQEMQTFKPTKNIASVREIRMDLSSMNLLQKYLIWIDKYEVKMYKDTLFAEFEKKHINNKINRTLHEVLETLGIEPISLHKLRHTQATILLAKGVKIEVVAKRLGHTDTTMVRTVYGHLLDSVEKEENEKIIELI